MSDERDFHFLTWTLDTGDRDRDEVGGWLETAVLPAWRSLIDDGVLQDGRAYWRVEDLEVPVAPLPWTVTLVAEVAADVDAEVAAQAEQDAFAAHGALASGVRVLGSDILAWTKESGAPAPLPSVALAGMPADWSPAVIYVDYPEEHLWAARRAMRDFHGPVSQLVLDRGDVYRMTITEVLTPRSRDAAAPPWNHMNLVEGDWDGGFEDAIRRAVPEVMGEDPSIMELVEGAHSLQRSRQVSRCVELASVAPALA